MKLPHDRAGQDLQSSAYRRRRVSVLLLASLLAWCACAPQAAAQAEQQLKVVTHIWGFDGRVQPGQFNPLSILLDNQTDDAFDATVTLQRVQGLLNPTGGQYVQQVFIVSTARKWIQLYPYVSDSRQCDWRLSVDGKKLADFTQPRPAWQMASEQNSDGPPKDYRPQVVILDKASRISTQPPSLKHMPENIFPPWATATFGLHTVFLDHVPDWELPRQEAFLSWLKQGGRLHLLRDSRGETPRFSGALAALNQPLTRFAVGSGVVIQHSLQRNEVDEELVRLAVVVDTLKGEDDEFEKIQEQLQQQGLPGAVETEPSSIDDGFFRKMRELTLPEHSWWLIFLLALCYIGLIFPGCFILSKKRDLHFLATYGAIVGLSLVFSMMFLLIGRRGYGETTNLQTLAIARAEDDTHWNVLQWNALFVTSGDDYSAGIKDQQAVLSTAETMDKSNALIVPGNDARIAMRIPPFSSQTFVSRRRLASNDWQLQVRDPDIRSSGLVGLTIQTGAGFPSGSDSRYLVLVGRRIYEMKHDQKTGSLTLFGQKRSLTEFCQPRYDEDYMNAFGQPSDIDERTNLAEFFDDSLSSLLRRSLLDDFVRNPSLFELPADRIRLFVYTAVPEDFAVNISADVKRTGRILFTKDIFLSRGAAGSQ